MLILSKIRKHEHVLLIILIPVCLLFMELLFYKYVTGIEFLLTTDLSILFVALFLIVWSVKIVLACIQNADKEWRGKEFLTLLCFALFFAVLFRFAGFLARCRFGAMNFDNYTPFTATATFMFVCLLLLSAMVSFLILLLKGCFERAFYICIVSIIFFILHLVFYGVFRQFDYYVSNVFQYTVEKQFDDKIMKDVQVWLDQIEMTEEELFIDYKTQVRLPKVLEDIHPHFAGVYNDNGKKRVRLLYTMRGIGDYTIIIFNNMTFETMYEFRK